MVRHFGSPTPTETTENPSNFVEFEYMISMNDELLEMFLDDPRVKATGVKTGCRVELTRRILNKKISGSKWMKYAIVRITGPDENAVKQCNLLLDRQFPHYRMRKNYPHRADVSVYTRNPLPDNTALYYGYHRTAPARPDLTDLNKPLSEQQPINKPNNVPAQNYLAARMEYDVEVMGITADENYFNEPDQEPEEDMDVGIGTKQGINKTYGNVMINQSVPTGAGGRPGQPTQMDKVIGDKITPPQGPLIIMFDGHDVIVSGHGVVGVEPSKGASGRLLMNVYSQEYRVNIEGTGNPMLVSGNQLSMMNRSMAN